MVIKNRFNYIVLFLLFLFPSTTIVAGFFSNVWSRCTVTNLFTGWAIGSRAYQLTDRAQMKTYTAWDGDSETYWQYSTGVLPDIKSNIERIAKELAIDISNLQLRSMNNPEKCAASLGIEVTRNYMFIHQSDIEYALDNTGENQITISPLINFADQNDPIATFLIKQELLKYKQSFYTRKVAHEIGSYCIAGFMMSNIHYLCRELASDVINPQLQNQLAQFAWGTTKMVGSIGLGIILSIAAEEATRSWKSRAGNSVYSKLIEDSLSYNACTIKEKLTTLRDELNPIDERKRLINRQLSILEEIG